MGIDFLDCMFRIEREFKLRHRDLDVDKLIVNCNEKGVWIGVTAVDVARWVEVCIVAKGQVPPPDLWPRVQTCIARTVSVSPEKVTPTSRIFEDLGFA